ncbi:queuosine precursor transporter [Desulfoplanes sp.]
MYDDEHGVYTLLVGLFVGGLVIAAVVSGKIVDFFGLYVPAGVLAYSVTFAVSDIISEIWGKHRATQMVRCGFVALAAAMVLSSLALHWPSAPFWNEQTAFDTVFGITPRIVLASLVAYGVSQTHDVWLFHLLRTTTGGKHLWLRNNLSTALSQLLDSTIFISLAFYGTMPLLPIIIGQWTAKMAIAVLDTPFVYLGVSILRGRMTGKPEPVCR